MVERVTGYRYQGCVPVYYIQGHGTHCTQTGGVICGRESNGLQIPGLCTCVLYTRTRYTLYTDRRVICGRESNGLQGCVPSCTLTVTVDTHRHTSGVWDKMVRDRGVTDTETGILSVCGVDVIKTLSLECYMAVDVGLINSGLLHTLCSRLP